jgi:von Willebrand factor A domain-containing protein 7
MRLAVWVFVTIGAASGSESQRVRFGPGVCGPIDPAYIQTATETGGQPFPLSTAEVGKSSRIMRSSLMPELLLWASGSMEYSYSIPIDSTVARMMVSGTFDGTGGSLTLTAPDGTVIRQGDRIEDTLLNCGRIITVDAPASGSWQVRTTPTGRFWLKVNARSGLSLMNAEFVEHDAAPESNRFVKIQGEPIAGRPATLRVRLSSAIKSPAFQFVSVDSRPLQALDLQSADTGEFTGAVALPTEPFRVVVKGSDESDMPVQRVWHGLFHAEVIEVVPPAGEQTLTAGSELSVTFTIRNHGPAVRLRLVASDQRGKVIAVEPGMLELGAGEEGNATVRLSMPPDAPAKGEASIRLTASSDPEPAIGGFNSAAKTFMVIRK